MKRAATYQHAEEQVLRFDGGLHNYLHDARQATLPDDKRALLEQLTHMGAFVDARLQQAYEARDDVMQAEDTVDDALALSVAWRWHSELARRAEPMTGLYAHARLLSWAALCQLFWQTLSNDAERLREVQTLRLQDYEYGQALRQRYSVEISDEPVGRYSVNDVWDSMALCVDSFYRVRYSEAQRHYLYALFYRYCAIATVGLDDSDAVEEEAQRVMDNPLFAQWRDDEAPIEEEDDAVDDAAFDAYKRAVQVPLTPQCALRSDYLYEGELLFYAQLHRVVLSERLHQLWADAPLVMREPLAPQGRGAALDAWLVFCRVVCLHKELRQFVLEDYKSSQMQLYLYHGEQERFQHRWPEANCTAGDVLGMLRSAQHMEAIRLQRVLPAALCTAYYAQVRREERHAVLHGAEPLYAFEGDALPSNDELQEQLRLRQLARQQQSSLQPEAAETEQDEGDYEKEALLCGWHITLRWLTYQGVQKRRLEQLLVMEELRSTLELDELLGRAATLEPTLLRLQRWYYVVHRGQVFRAAHFVDAYGVWLSRLVAAGLVPAARLYSTVRECLGQFACV